MRLFSLITLALMASAGVAAAEPVLCKATVNGVDMPLAYDPAEDGLRAFYSVREIMFTKWKRDTCPSYVVLRALTPDLTDAQRQPFCLQHQDDAVIGYDLGQRNAYGRCKAPRRGVCQRVNATRDAALGLASGAARRTFAGVETVRTLPGGAVVLQGAKGRVVDALGMIGGAAASLGSSPAIVTGAAVSVVAVGGAVYACSGTDRGAGAGAPDDGAGAGGGTAGPG